MTRHNILKSEIRRIGTTIKIDPELLYQAKVEAAKRRKTLGFLVEEGLRRVLACRETQKKSV
jgi:hypothetical protein